MSTRKAELREDATPECGQGHDYDNTSLLNDHTETNETQSSSTIKQEEECEDQEYMRSMPGYYPTYPGAFSDIGPLSPSRAHPESASDTDSTHYNGDYTATEANQQESFSDSGSDFGSELDLSAGTQEESGLVQSIESSDYGSESGNQRLESESESGSESSSELGSEPEFGPDDQEFSPSEISTLRQLIMKEDLKRQYGSRKTEQLQAELESQSKLIFAQHREICALINKVGTLECQMNRLARVNFASVLDPNQDNYSLPQNYQSPPTAGAGSKRKARTYEDAYTEDDTEENVGRRYKKRKTATRYVEMETSKKRKHTRS